MPFALTRRARKGAAGGLLAVALPLMVGSAVSDYDDSTAVIWSKGAGLIGAALLIAWAAKELENDE